MEICANVVSVFASQAPDDEIFTEEEEAFVCDESDKLSAAPVPTREGQNNRKCSASSWRAGDLAAICGNGTSCHMHY